MKRDAACMCINRGWVEIGDNTAYRYFINNDFEQIVNSDFFQSKMNEYWIWAKKIDKFPEDIPQSITGQTFYSYEVDYIPHITRCVEFTPQQLVDSLELLCDISIYCLDHSMWCGTHLWNIVLKNGKPILIDIGDFGKKQPTIYDVKKTILGVFYNYPPFNINVSDWISNSDEMINKFETIIIDKNITLINKIKNIKTELKSCKLVNIPYIWSNYITSFPDDISNVKNLFNKKSQVICNVIDDKKPHTMTDLGCNVGIYSFYANKMYNTKTIGVDYCTDAVDYANKYSNDNGFSSSFVSYNLLNPPKAYGINDAFGTVYERYQSDGVIAPALIHHLYMQSNSITEILDIISSYTKKWMLIEFIPHNCTTIKADPNKWYNTDEFEGCLTKLGFTFKIFDSYPSPRKWYYCEKLNNNES